MNFHRFSFFSLFIFFCLETKVLSSPVLIWSNLNLPILSVPLTGFTAEDLISNHICTLSNSKLEVRLFAVENLEIEDLEEVHAFLSYAKTENSKVRYYPDVTHDPYATFSSLTTSKNPKCSHIEFKVVHKNTYEQLEHALNAIQGNIDNVEGQSTKNVLIVLLRADSNRITLSRNRRALPSSTKQIVVSSNKTCMFYAESLIWTTMSDTNTITQSYNLAVQSSQCVTIQINATVVIQQTTLELVWIGNNNTNPNTLLLNLTATINGTLWYLTGANMNNISYRHFAFGMDSPMKTPLKFCYACNNAYFVRYNVTPSYNGYNFSDTFHITNFQFQPFLGDGMQFGQVNYCTSFFTRGIWMGITTSLLLLGILLFGVHQMMSIKANDRFDDPKGKPLLIKAQE